MSGVAHYFNCMDVTLSDHSNTEAEQLLRRYADGDPLAAQALTKRFLPQVYGHAKRLLNDEAEAQDVAQEAMLRLWKIAAVWRSGEAQVSTWLYRVTANLCTDVLRRRRSVGLDEIAEPADARASATHQIQQKTRTEALQSALNQLPARQREAVVLRHLEGLGNTEIAQIMEISPRAVESLTARGKRELTVRLRGYRAALGYVDDQE